MCMYILCAVRYIMHTVILHGNTIMIATMKTTVVYIVVNRMLHSIPNYTNYMFY